jgi:hypothetical protein
MEDLNSPVALTTVRPYPESLRAWSDALKSYKSLVFIENGGGSGPPRWGRPGLHLIAQLDSIALGITQVDGIAITLSPVAALERSHLDTV